MAEGDYVTVRWSAQIFKLGPDGKDTEVGGMSLCRFQDGRIHRVWQLIDILALLKAACVVAEDVSIKSVISNS